jgi:hypothetical protein
MSEKYKVKLQAALYALTRPGAPAYPTRKVRHEAAAILDELFPSGAIVRRMVNNFFRVFYQLSWPKHFFLWLIKTTWSVVSFPYRYVKEIFAFQDVFKNIDFKDEQMYSEEESSGSDTDSSTLSDFSSSEADYKDTPSIGLDTKANVNTPTENDTPSVPESKTTSSSPVIL